MLGTDCVPGTKDPHFFTIPVWVFTLVVQVGILERENIRNIDDGKYHKGRTKGCEIEIPEVNILMLMGNKY